MVFNTVNNEFGLSWYDDSKIYFARISSAVDSDPEPPEVISTTFYCTKTTSITHNEYDNEYAIVFDRDNKVYMSRIDEAGEKIKN